MSPSLYPVHDSNVFSRSNNKNKKVTFAAVDDVDKCIDYLCLEHVENICESLATCSQEDCLRFILDDKRKLWAIDTVDRDCRVQIDKNCMSLEHLLPRTPKSPKRSKGLKKSQRLSLAVKLASSLLQLHATPWLPESWCKKSVYFPVDVEQPYVIIKFDESSASSPNTHANFLNPYLVALGIILLELSEGIPFLEWINGRNDISLQSNDILNRADIASKWLEESKDAKHMSETYADVVRLCLECSFTLVQPSQRTLTNEKFREAVYRGVVQQLEKVYDTFTNPLRF